jgi:hypothetical protein
MLTHIHRFEHKKNLKSYEWMTLPSQPAVHTARPVDKPTEMYFEHDICLPTGNTESLFRIVSPGPRMLSFELDSVLDFWDPG